MERAFLNILNMSITASYVILFVILARVLLKRAPKIFSYGLWGIVLFRLLIPFSYASAFSFLNFLKAKSLNHIPVNISYAASPQVNVGIDTVNLLVNNSLPGATPTASVNPMQILVFILSIIWIIGITVLLTYSVVTYIHLQIKVSTAMHITDNIYESEKIKSPFVLGLLRPQIYLPVGLNEKERGYILKHEETHIKRYDYLIKPAAFFALCLHWFNPLVWAAFILMCRDMEMSCDERVLKELGGSIKKDYTNSLLAFAIDRSILNSSPLAFGESDTKRRIKNVLSYKKPTFWVIAAAALLVIIAGVGLSLNPSNGEIKSSFLDIKNTILAAQQQEQLLIRVHGGSTSLASGSTFAKLLDETASNWQEKKSSSPLELAPDLTVYINIGNNHMIHFYESEQELAMVRYGEQFRYYRVSADTYRKVQMLWSLSSYAIYDDIMNAIADGKRTDLQSVQDVPVNVDYKTIRVGRQSYYIYEKNGSYYVEQPYQFIREIPAEVYLKAIKFASPALIENKTASEIKNLVEDKISEIISSPLQSSNPDDYIKAHQDAYHDILKHGGEEALIYMLSEFQKGTGKNDLRGHIMMRLCKELLGQRNNVIDEKLSPTEWFSQLRIRQKIKMPDFVYSGNDSIEKLVYETEIEKNKRNTQFTIVAPHIFGSYEEGDRLKIFATTFSSHYSLYEKTLANEGGSIVPAAITYVKDSGGNYKLEKYEQTGAGSEFAPSIKRFCVLPQSGKTIPGLADKILSHYGNYKDILELERSNLIEHLKKNEQFGVFLYQEHYQKPAELIPLT